MRPDYLGAVRYGLLFKAVSATVSVTILVGCGSAAAPGQLPPPPGYDDVPGSPDVLLRPAHQGSVGSEFTQDCTGFPIPPQPGEVGWHFVLPQSVVEERAQGGRPGNIFAELVVTFAGRGTVTLTTFGPPSAAHAYVITPTDDTLARGFRRHLSAGAAPTRQRTALQLGQHLRS